MSQLTLGKLDGRGRHTNRRSSLIWFAARGGFWMQSVLVLVYLSRLLSCLEAICKLYFFSHPPTAWQAQHYSHRTGYSITGKITGFTWYSTKLTCFPFGAQDKAHLCLGLVGRPHYSPVGSSSPYQQSKSSRNSSLQLFGSKPIVWCVWSACEVLWVNQRTDPSRCTYRILYTKTCCFESCLDYNCYSSRS